MKSIFTFLLAIVTVTTFAQKDFQGKATYMSKRTMDMSRFGDQMSEQQKKQMMARFKNYLEKTFTLNFNKTESSFKENVKLDAPGTAARSWGSNNGQGSIYKNLKSKEMIEDVEQFSKRFRVMEAMDQPKWEMGAETKKIGQYTCYKATMVKVDNTIDWGSIFSRRRNTKKKDSTKTATEKDAVKMVAVTAWYTPQIPVSSGPGVYFGLPGLILEINEGRTTMLCTEIALNPSEAVEIKRPTKGKEVNREDYNKIVKEKTAELKEQFKSRRSGGRRN
ncbi:MAG: GLPGLI family protein [Polaribacter sp.]|nr:GLPGLI family protein [Polaribacter sp.]